MKNSQVLNATYLFHDRNDLLRSVLENPQIVTINFRGKLTFDPAHRFLHVVRDGLGEVPDHAWDLFELSIHGGNELLLVLVKAGTPLFFRFEIDEILGIEKASCVSSVIRAA